MIAVQMVAEWQLKVCTDRPLHDGATVGEEVDKLDIEHAFEHERLGIVQCNTFPLLLRELSGCHIFVPMEMSTKEGSQFIHSHKFGNFLIFSLLNVRPVDTFSIEAMGATTKSRNSFAWFEQVVKILIKHLFQK